MKKIEVKEFTLLITIILLGVFIGFNLFNTNKETFISDNDFLYDSAIEYLLKNDKNIDKKEDNYKKFFDYEGFGISKDKKYKYVYMWVISDSYYVKNNKLVVSSSNSLPYKFIINKKSNEVIDFVVPRDGRIYVIDVKNMFPGNISDKVLNYTADDSKLKKMVKEYYKDIEFAE